MPWTATITDKRFVNDNFVVTVTFTDGDLTYDKNFSPNPDAQNDLENQIKQSMQQIQKYQTYADAIVVGTKLDDKGGVIGQAEVIVEG